MEKGKKILKITRIWFYILVFFILITYLYSFISYRIDDYKYVQELVLEEAEKDVGVDAEIYSIKYNRTNKEYQVKITSKQLNCEIVYIVDTNNNKFENYTVKKFIERKKIKPFDWTRAEDRRQGDEDNRTVPLPVPVTQINMWITTALNSSTRYITNSEDSFYVIYDFGQQIGTKGEQAIKVVFTTAGKIITAFPVK